MGFEEINLGPLDDFLNASAKPNGPTSLSYTASCRVVLYHYIDPNPPENADFATTMFVERANFKSMEVHNPVMSFTYTKTNNAAAGYFQLVFSPTENWLKQMSPGDWVAIYLDNGRQGEHLRCLGNIDSVSMQESISPENGARSVRYVATGQDFGKVFESYCIYMHPFLQESATTQLIIPSLLQNITGGPSEVVRSFIDVFLSAKSEVFPAFKLPRHLQQWLIPSQLADDLVGRSTNAGSFSSTKATHFYDIMDTSKITSGLPGTIVISLLDVNNSLWGILKSNCNPYINELFCEMTDEGKPAVYLRTIPFTFRNFSVDGNSEPVLRFLDLPSVRISGAEILSSAISIGEQARFNFTVLLTTGLSGDPRDSLGLISGKFPHINRASCNRYGLRVYEGVTNYGLSRDQNNPDLNILSSWNRLIQHWTEKEPSMESIQLQLMGNRDVRIGKRLDIVDGPLLENISGVTRSYYIEGYTDSWHYPNSWVQQIMATRGVFVKSGREEFTYKLSNNLHNFTSVSLHDRGRK